MKKEKVDLGKPLTMSEINSRYESEWVLLADPQTDEKLEVKGGRVLYHSRDRDEFDRKSLDFRAKRLAVVFTGKPLKGIEFVL